MSVMPLLLRQHTFMALDAYIHSHHRMQPGVRALKFLQQEIYAAAYPQANFTIGGEVMPASFARLDPQPREEFCRRFLQTEEQAGGGGSLYAPPVLSLLIFHRVVKQAGISEAVKKGGREQMPEGGILAFCSVQDACDALVNFNNTLEPWAKRARGYVAFDMHHSTFIRIQDQVRADNV